MATTLHKLTGTDPSRWRSAATHAFAVIAALTLIGLPVFFVARDHLTSPNLWFDESGQVFVSLGLHHYTAPNTPHGGWGQMLEYSRPFNGDPNGFTVLLRLWMSIFGYAPVALRSLPFFFFLLIPLMIFSSAKRSGIHPVIAVLAASSPLGFPVMLHYATEVRAYSMEMCAVTFLFFLPCWLSEETSAWALEIGCAAALLITSRYSAFVGAAAACGVALLPLRPLRAATQRALSFALPPIITGVLCYLLFARYQLTGGARLPAVFEPFVLYGKDATAKLALLRENFFATGAFPVTFYLLAAPLFAWFGPRSLARLRSLVARTCLFAALYVGIVAVASLTGRLPWAWETRWSIGYQTLSACCFAMIIIAAGTSFWEMATGWHGKGRVTALGACLVAVWSIQLQETVRSEHPYYETLGTHLRALAGSADAKSFRFFVQINATPTTRYLVELGPLKGAFTYPKNFHFETQQEANAKVPISAKEYDIIVLTNSQFADAYRARVAGGTAQISASPPPSCLLVLGR